MLAGIPILILTGFVTGCQKAEPERAPGVEIPTGPRDDGYENNSDIGNDNGGLDTNGAETDNTENGEIGGGNSNSGTEEGDEGDIDRNNDYAAIAGDWGSADGATWFSFDSSRRFKAISTKKIGFKSDPGTEVRGTYTYESFKRHLWLSAEGENEIYNIEFRCIIEGNRMTLYGMTGNVTIELTRN